MRASWVVLFVSLCSCGSDNAKKEGTEGGPCYGNGTCNAGLVCLSNLCVMPSIVDARVEARPADVRPDDTRPADRSNDQASKDATQDISGCFTGSVKGATIAFYDYFDLDTGTFEKVVGVPKNAGWDFKFAYNSTSTPHTFVFHNVSTCKVAEVSTAFSAVSSCDASTATFGAAYISKPFDANRVFLIKTDLGAIFKIGESVETTDKVTFSYAKLTP